jgi:glycosyltransferase involved in cell wall biosynthesis
VPVIAISSVLKRRLKRNDYVTVINGAAETNSIDYYDISVARDQLGLSGDIFIVGMSNFAEEDLGDNIVFLDAFAKLAKEYDHIRLFVTGEESFVRRYFGGTSYEDKLIFPGWLSFDAYSRYLCACSVLVLPFRNTPRNAGRWPNKIGDYLCANRPIISNRTGDISRLFDSFKIGFTCDETSEGFYRVLKPLLDEGTKLTEHCIDSAYISTEILSFDKRVCSIVDFYEQCLHRK